MTTPLLPRTAALLASLVLLTSCETDNNAPSSAASNFENFRIEPPPPGVHTVRVKIDTSPPNADISLNGFKVGFTPKEIHLSADDSGRLTIPVNISINYVEGASGRAMLGAGAQGAGPRSTSYLIQQGDRPPATILFNSDMRIDGRTPAPFDLKPTTPDAHREGGGD